MKELWKLRKYAKKFIWTYFFAMVAGWPMAAIQIYTVKQMKPVLDEIFMNKNIHSLMMVPLTLMGLWSANGVCRYLHFVLQRRASERTINLLRNDIYKKFMGMGVDFYSSSKTGELMARIINDIQVLFQGLGTIFDLTREPFILIGLLTYAIWTNWKLTLITLVLLPLFFTLMDRIGKALRRYGHRSQEVVGEMSNLMQESFSGIRMIKSYDLESFMKERFSKVNQKSMEVAFKTIRVEEASQPILDILLVGVVALVIYLGGASVIDGTMTPGDFFTYLGALAMIQNPIRQLNNCAMKLNVASTAAKRINDIFAMKESIQENAVEKSLSEFHDSIEFKNVTFSYGNLNVLENINFKVKKGTEIAIVGPSGAGKSTILHLLPRLYDISAGEILIDGKNIKDIHQKNLRSIMSYVSQDVFLFHDTVRENLCLDKKYSDAEIWAALDKAYATEFVKNLNEGLETIIGERGVKLSGGQRQRLSIARAVLRDTPILLLDEATSALDTQSEREVQIALDSLMAGKTTIVVAHRISTIVKADEILVLQQGHIVQRGTHEGLLQTQGLYQNLVKLQAL